MAIIENRATEAGDVIYIQANIPIIGLIALSSFLSNTTGESETQYFYKEFRYSTDGINYSAWVELTEANLTAIELTIFDTFYIQYRYTYMGTTGTDLSFNSVRLTGEFQYVDCGFAFENSIFSEFFGCSDLGVLNWCINVLEKIYKKGIIPEYIERNVNANNYNVDADYIAFWKSITCFFATLVHYGRQFETLPSNTKLLSTYLKNRGLYFCDNLSLEDLTYLKSHFYDEIRQRGTKLMITEKGINNKPIDGEILRLICKLAGEEFKFALTPDWGVGWCIGRSSPLFKGASTLNFERVGYEATDEVLDLDNYPLLNSEYIAIVTDSEINKSVMRLNLGPNTPGVSTGIMPTLKSQAFLIDNNLNYEISFKVKRPTPGVIIPALYFNLLGFTASDLDNVPSNKFFTIDNYYWLDEVVFEDLNLSDNTNYYTIKLYLLAKSTQPILGNFKYLRIGQGEHRRNNNNIYIAPQIFITNNHPTLPSNPLYLYDLKINILSTNYSLGFVNCKNLFQTWLRNNNLQYSTTQIEQIIREYMLPYNSTIIYNWLSSIDYSELSSYKLHRLWILWEELNNAFNLAETARRSSELIKYNTKFNIL